ncbi:Proton extrusion protein PcxA, partial [Dissostichus eleginoides]
IRAAPSSGGCITRRGGSAAHHYMFLSESSFLQKFTRNSQRANRKSMLLRLLLTLVCTPLVHMLSRHRAGYTKPPL